MGQSDQRRRVQLGVIILAAGASRRMGRPKLLLPWGATSILGHLIQQWEQLSAHHIAVVCAANDNAVDQELDRLAFPQSNRIRNDRPELGMFSSIRCAAVWSGWQSGLSHWVIVLGDQPHIKPETLRALLDFSRAHPERVCEPGFQGRPRHPVVLPRAVLRRLRRTRAATLKQFLQRESARLALCALEDPGLDADIDTPADYARACRTAADSRR